ncbi:hypothetical protein EBO15_31475 [Actinomadura harenae]|uniref:Uncharacterized protein n=1 Tax=Actinomadura harenae TaxID=2483351 RepID=A0A3M2LVE2_9ACTN|nr:hypothetical protein EBO15_31475 [Actinomadura harenae]
MFGGVCLGFEERCEITLHQRHSVLLVDFLLSRGFRDVHARRGIADDARRILHITIPQAALFGHPCTAFALELLLLLVFAACPGDNTG